MDRGRAVPYLGPFLHGGMAQAMLHPNHRGGWPTLSRQHGHGPKRQRALSEALARLRAIASAGGTPSRELFSDLVRAWGNIAWTAKPDYLAAVFAAARATRGPILECGSGLTTVLLALAREEQAVSAPVCALEHHAGWAEKVRGRLDRLRLDGVRVCQCELIDYGPFTWYSLPVAELPRAFGLVICDGPPGRTPGGRYGLVPVLGDRLAPGCVILLDDAQRLEERSIAGRWGRELGASVAWSHPDPTTFTGKSYARLVVGDL